MALLQSLGIRIRDPLGLYKPPGIGNPQARVGAVEPTPLIRQDRDFPTPEIPTGASVPSAGRSSGYPDDPFERGGYVRDYLIDNHDLPHHVASGIAGHGIQESRLDPNAYNANEGAIGAFQWRGDRAQNLKSFAKRRGKDWTDIDTQLDFMVWESSQPAGGGASKALKSARNLDEAVSGFMHYERPQGYTRNNPAGGHAYDKRLNYARRIAGQERRGRFDREVLEAPRQDGFSGALSFKNKGQEGITPEFRSILMDTSAAIGAPLRLTSGHRNPWHKVERRKKTGPGQHTKGHAGDIDMAGMSDAERANLVRTLHERGARRFITYTNSPDMLHVDLKKQGGKDAAWFMHDRYNRNLPKAPGWYRQVAGELHGKKPGSVQSAPTMLVSDKSDTGFRAVKLKDPMGLYPRGKESDFAAALGISGGRTGPGPGSPSPDRFAPELSAADQMDLTEPALRPFRPDEFLQNPDGSRSTERSTTIQDADGQWVNVPTLWKRQNGIVEDLSGDENRLRRTVAAAEAQGPLFQRHATVDDAVKAAEARTAAGGAAAGPEVTPRYVEMSEAEYAAWKKDFDAQEPGIGSDFWNLLKTGSGGLIESLDWLANKAYGSLPGGETIVEALDTIDRTLIGETAAESGARIRAEGEAGLSRAQRAARQKQWVTEHKNADGSTSYSLGPAWLDPRSYFGVTVESVPATAVTMLPGGILARGAYLGALAKGATQAAAAKAAAKTALISGAVTEGIVGGAETGKSIREQIEALPQEVLNSSEALRHLEQGGMSRAEAIDALASDAETQGFLISGAVTSLFGGQGDRVLARILAEGVGGNVVKRIARGAARGAVAEGLVEELPQSIGQQIAENVGVQTVDPSRGTFEQVPNAAVAGTIGGAGIGGPVGAAGGAVSPVAEPEPDIEVTPAELEPQLAEISPEEIAPAPEPKKGPLRRAVDRATEIAPERFGPTFEVGATVMVDPPGGIPSFMARVESIEDGEAVVFDARSGEIYQVPLGNLRPIAAAPQAEAPLTPEGGPIEAVAPRSEEIAPVPPETAPETVETAPVEPAAQTTEPTQNMPENIPDQAEEVIAPPPAEPAVQPEDMQAEPDIMPESATDMPETAEIMPEEAEPPTAAPAPAAPQKTPEAAAAVPAPAPEPGAAPVARQRTVRDRAATFPDEASAQVYDYAEKFRKARNSRLPMSRIRTLLADDRQAAADALGVTPQRVHEIADDYWYRVNRYARQVERDAFDAPPINAKRLAEWRKERTDQGTLELPAGKGDVSQETQVSTPAPKQPKTTQPAATVDAEAHQAATSPTNDKPEPTDAQKEAENYEVGSTRVGGMDVSVENPEGSTRSGTSRTGKTWSQEMKSHYGRIKGTTGMDGDHLDIFIRPGTPKDLPGDTPVFVVDQVNPETGKPDEHKVMLGWQTEADARKAYLENYEKGWKGLDAVTPTTLDEFKTWAADEKATKKPFKDRKAEPAATEAAAATKSEKPADLSTTGSAAENLPDRAAQYLKDAAAFSDPIWVAREAAKDPAAMATRLEDLRAEAAAVRREILKPYNVRSADDLAPADVPPLVRDYLFYTEVPTDVESIRDLEVMTAPVATPQEAVSEIRATARRLPETSNIDDLDAGQKLQVGRLIFLGSEMSRMGVDPADALDQATRDEAGEYDDQDDANFMARNLVARLGLFVDRPAARPRQKKLAGRPSEVTAERGRVIPRDPKPYNVVNYTDYGIDNFEYTGPVGDAAAKWVLQEGRRVGVEFMLAIDENGDVIAHGRGTKSSTGMTPVLWNAMRGKSEQVVLHHNHPRGSTFSAVDIGALAMPGLKAIYAHAHNGEIHRAQMTPKAVAYLQSRVKIRPFQMGGTTFNQLREVVDDLYGPLHQGIQKAINRKQITMDHAQRIDQHLHMWALRDAGWILYGSTAKLGNPLENDYVREGFEKARDRYAEKIANVEAPGIDRPAKPVRYAGDMATIPGGDEKTAAQPAAKPDAGTRRSAPQPVTGQADLFSQAAAKKPKKPAKKAAKKPAAKKTEEEQLNEGRQRAIDRALASGEISDIPGSEGGKRALEVAAAGNHTITLTGDPDAIRMLRASFPGIGGNPDLIQPDGELLMEIQPISNTDWLRPAPAEISSDIRKRVETARNRANDVNPAPDAGGNKLLAEAQEKLPAEVTSGVLVLARTLAAMDGAPRPGRLHIAEAVSYRMPAAAPAKPATKAKTTKPPQGSKVSPTRVAETPFPLSPGERKEIDSIVRQVANVAPNWAERIEVPPDSDAGRAWGVTTPTYASGFYDPYQDLITLSLAHGDAEAAYHEAFHRLQYQFLTDAERRILRDDRARLKRMVRPLRGPQTNRMTQEELEAEAFAAYATGATKIKPHRRIRTKWDQLIRVIRRILNMLRGRGYQISEDIFETAKSGAMARAPVTRPVGGRRSVPQPAHSILYTRTAGLPQDGTHVTSYRNTSVIRRHPAFAAAKAGDGRAAAKLVADTVKRDTVDQARKAFGDDVIYAPVMAVEASGTNAIPAMLAAYYASNTGAERTGDILQVNKVYHTDAGAMERLLSRSVFDGPVKAGRSYVIVDDVSAMGSTLADMANHIVNQGGKVAGVVTLVNQTKSNKLAAPPSAMKQLSEKFGDEEISSQFGIDPAALSAPEAAYLLTFKSAVTLGKRIASAKKQRAARLGPRDLSRQEPDISLTPGEIAPPPPPPPGPPPRGGGPRRFSENRFIEDLKGRWTDLQPSLLTLVPLNYFSELKRPNMKAVDDYLRMKRKLDAYRGHKHGESDKLAQRWLKYLRGGLTQKGVSRDEQLSKLMHDATLAGVDPAAPTDKMKRSPAYADIKAQFDALPAAGQTLFRDVRDAYREQSEELDRIILDNVRKATLIAEKRAEADYKRELDRIDRSDATEKAKKAARKQAAADFKAARQMAGYSMKARITRLRKAFEASRVPPPYFPLGRFGRYFVLARAKDGSVISFSKREKAAERDRLARQLKRQYPDAEITAGVMKEGQSARDTMDPRLIAEMEKMLEGLNLDPATMSGVLDSIWQRYLQTLPDLSIRKRYIHRKGTPGFDTDALRVFSNHMFHAAHQMARLKYGLELAETLNDVAEQADQADDQTRAQTLANEMRKRHDWVMNPQGSSAAQAATSGAFVWYLGATPAAAFVNMTQTPILGVPILGARFGSSTQAAKELVKASRDALSGKGLPSNSSKLSAEEKRAMESFYDSGLIDRTRSHDLAGVGDTGVKYTPVRAYVMEKIAWLFHNAEVWNREVTALAAYRMARKAGQNQNEAINTAHDLTWKVHFDYSNASRPRVMQNDAAKVALVFRAHTINMLYRLIRDAHQSFKGESPQIRREARKQFAGILGMMAAFAGLAGIPGFNLMMSLASLVLGDEDDPFDYQERFKQDVLEMLGPRLGPAVLYGIPGHYGGVNLTNRIGMPDLWFQSPTRDLEGRDLYEHYLYNLLGAAIGIGGSVVGGLQALSEGEWQKGVEGLVPKAVRDLLRARRYGAEGLTDWGGNTILSPDQITKLDQLRQALGFTPAKVQEAWARRGALKRAESRVYDRRQKIISAFAEAVEADDKAAMDAAIEDVIRFNAVPLHAPAAITADSLRRSVKTRALNDAKRLEGTFFRNQRLGIGLTGELPPAVYRP